MKKIIFLTIIGTLSTISYLYAVDSRPPTCGPHPGPAFCCCWYTIIGEPYAGEFHVKPDSKTCNEGTAAGAAGCMMGSDCPASPPVQSGLIDDNDYPLINGVIGGQ